MINTEDIVRVDRTDTKMDYESASQRTSPNLVLCYVRMFLLECFIWITMDPNPGLLKIGA